MIFNKTRLYHNGQKLERKRASERDRGGIEGGGERGGERGGRG